MSLSQQNVLREAESCPTDARYPGQTTDALTQFNLVAPSANHRSGSTTGELYKAPLAWRIFQFQCVKLLNKKCSLTLQPTSYSAVLMTGSLTAQLTEPAAPTPEGWTHLMTGWPTVRIQSTWNPYRQSIILKSPPLARCIQ